MRTKNAAVVAAVQKVEETFGAYNQSRRRFNLSTRPEVRAARQAEMAAARAAYEDAARQRDAAVAAERGGR
jgi:hypothetical protein